jgi:hypothetical protein
MAVGVTSRLLGNWRYRGCVGGVGAVAVVKIFIVVLAAYFIAGIHYVWRDLREPVIRQPAYARSRRIPALILAVLFWLPATLAMPGFYGWYWKSLKRYVYSLFLFVLLICVGLWF